MTQTHKQKLVSEADLFNLPAEPIQQHELINWFNSLPSAPEVGEAVAWKYSVMTALAWEEKLSFTRPSDAAIKLGKIAELTALYTTPQPDRTAEQDNCDPVLWTQLTPAGKVAYFDGKPMYSTERNEIHTVPLYARKPTDRTAELEAQLAELDEEIERLQSYEQGLKDVIAWMKERGLYHDADYFGEGADFASILTEHEQQVSACTERQIKADNKRLVEALKEAQHEIDHVRLFTKNSAWFPERDSEVDRLNKQHADNEALLAEMEAKG